MEPFMNVFFAIDLNQSEKITTEQLRDYVTKNHLDDGMIQRWQSLFDSRRTGIITFQRFCEVLGVKPEQARILRSSISAAQYLGSDIHVIFANMSMEDQIKISDQTRVLTKPPNELDDRLISMKLKQWLDVKYGTPWHVIVVDGSYWTTYSYLQNCSFQFRLNNKSYLIWRTPDL